MAANYATDDILMNGNFVIAVGCVASTHARCRLATVGRLQCCTFCPIIYHS